MNYFNKFYVLSKEEEFLEYRNLKKSLFKVGDILSLFYRNQNFNFFFEGLCISIKKKNTPDFSFILRNYLDNVGIEIIFSFFYNRIFFLQLNDYKRKKFFYNHSKLFYLRYKFNKDTLIK